jgi:hypothetical protein
VPGSSPVIVDVALVEAVETPAGEQDDSLIPAIPIAPMTAALDDFLLRGGDGLL